MRIDGYRARQELAGLSTLCQFLHPACAGHDTNVLRDVGICKSRRIDEDVL